MEEQRPNVDLSIEKKSNFVSLKQKIRVRLSEVKPHHLGILATALILVALPVTLALVKTPTNTGTSAAEITSNANVLAAEQAASLLPSDDIANTDVAVSSISPSSAKAIYDKDAKTVNSLPTTVVAGNTKPNVVIIMIDDINPADGRLFTQARTPNIYKYITSTGVKFDKFYGETSLCCPGRVGFLTGQHTHNHGVLVNDVNLFNPTESLATELQGLGYATMLTGKYLNNFNSIPPAKAIPPGWGRFDAIYEVNGQYYNYRLIHKDGSIKQYGNTPSDYSTDVIANQNIIRLKAAPADQPIFDYIAPYAIHGDGHDPSTNTIRQTKPAPRHIGDPRCKNIGTYTPPNFNEADMSDKPTYEQAWASLPYSGYSLVKPCESLLSVDEMVGRIVDTLKEQHRFSNTVFILMGDNGMGWGQHRFESKGQPFTTQIPVYISWQAGRGLLPRTDSTTLSNIDFAPTICEIAGCVMGPYPNGQDIADGLSFLPLIKNQALNWSRDTIIEEGSIGSIKWFGARTTAQNSLGLWHYIEDSTGENELYDLSHGPCSGWKVSFGGDPCELTNLLSSKSAPSAYSLSIASQLHDRLARLKGEKGSVKPTPTPTVTPSPTPMPTFTPTPTVIPSSTPTDFPTPTPTTSAINNPAKIRVTLTPTKKPTATPVKKK